MSNPYHHRPLLCCCLPRLGIITMCILFGIWALIGLLEEVLGFFINEEQSSSLVSLSSLVIVINTTCSLVYFYASYKAYHKDWTHFQTCIYFFILNTITDIYSCIILIHKFIKVFQSSSPPFEPQSTMETSEDDDHQPELSKFALFIFFTCFVIVFSVLPIILQIFFVNDARSYSKYVMHKKEAKPCI
ncbi:uncharacterized protein BX664DRAFT_171085 [Halteromyces radiatus]|uniref:uncharacterized protein n=1 Tax=Halteromyces radiatus TaxID=101107 RepID=UPI002220CA57|nr:uncharacterized protein BX664DRAFT_171085 [Halteromyces radiatus]KAI8084703.1 hypothetical protein BX664DRAFT_171085 [Halteromyces radiatus]